MARTLEEVRELAMELSRDERVRLSDELAISAWAPGVLDAWIAESERRVAALKSGDDPGLSEEAFWQDE
jgi:hypothetical protein